MLGAIANAIYDACGVRVTELPITPEKILHGPRERASRARGRSAREGGRPVAPIDDGASLAAGRAASTQKKLDRLLMKAAALIAKKGFDGDVDARPQHGAST